MRSIASLSRVIGVFRCWKLPHAVHSTGYVYVHANGCNRKAHRLVYVELIGSIPHGLDLDHLCRNRWCVHPNHVQPVTRAVNAQRGISFNGSKTHCPRGHALRGTNVKYNMVGGRLCAECRRTKSRERKRRVRNQDRNAL